jgi:NTP pyrophosphatase (non-canonical NTP hydrolase)
MQSDFENLLDLTRKSIVLDPWIDDCGLNGYCDEIVKEVKELKAAIDSNDIENMQDEIGDVLMDWCSLCLLAEKKCIADVGLIIQNITAKIKRRRPYLEHNKKVTKQQAHEIWLKAKEAERK